MILYFPVLFFMLELNFVKCYKGESFPAIYLQAEDVVPEYSDVDYYLKSITKILGAFAVKANDTDINGGLGMFYMKAILKRTIQENKNKIHEDQIRLINSVILQTDSIMSHFFYAVNPAGWDDIEKRVAELLKDDDLQIQAIGNFNRNRLQKWLLTDMSMNDFEQSMDELQMSREMFVKYIDIGDNSDDYTLNADSSNYCIGETIYNRMPLDGAQALKPCVDTYCSSIVYEDYPSIAYALSHRMLVVVLPRHLRGCYLRGAAADAALLERLCAAMYREAVYLARRGYFNRDLWMEHIALCALLGYEEFHRRHWFRKVVSWVDDQGCIAENFNFNTNYSRLMLAHADTPEERQMIRKHNKMILEKNCYWHAMAISLVVLAHGVRHAVQFSESDGGKIKDEL